MTAIDTSVPFYKELIVPKKHWEEAPVQGTRIAFTNDAQIPKWIGGRITLLNEANDYYQKVQTGELSGPHPDIVLQFSRPARFWRHPIQYVGNLMHMKQAAKDNSVAIEQLQQVQEFQLPYGLNVAKRRLDDTPIHNPHIAFTEDARMPKSLLKRIKLLNQANAYYRHVQEDEETGSHPGIVFKSDSPVYFWKHPIQYVRNLAHMKQIAKGKYVAARELDPALKFRPEHGIPSNPLSAKNKEAIEKEIQSGFTYMDPSWVQHLKHVLSGEDVSDRQVFGLLLDAQPEDVQFMDKWDSLMNLANDAGKPIFHPFMTAQELDGLTTRTQQKKQAQQGAVIKTLKKNAPQKASASEMAQMVKGIKKTLDSLSLSPSKSKYGMAPPLSSQDKQKLAGILNKIEADDATEETIRDTIKQELAPFLNSPKVKAVTADLRDGIEKNRLVLYKGSKIVSTVLHPDMELVYKLQKQVKEFLANLPSPSPDVSVPVKVELAPAGANFGPASWSIYVPQ